MGTAKKATLEDAWSIIAELGKAQKETDRQLKETDLRLNTQWKNLQEVVEKTSKSIKEANGNFNNKWGEFLENFIEGDLPNIFRDRNIEVKAIFPRVKAERENKSVEAEYDFIVVNGKEVIVIEVKTTVSSNKLDALMDKLKHFRKRFPEHNNKKLYGGVAYIKANKTLLQRIEKAGLFKIQAPSGKNHVTRIINPADFIPTPY